jgi:hypothetical protein
MLEAMKGFVAVLVLSSIALAQIRVTLEAPSPPTITISADVRIALVPGLLVVERVAEPQGIVVLYRSSRVAEVYAHHHRDLVARGWTRVKYQAEDGRYRSEYRKGRAKTKLEVRDRRGRVEVRLKEG